VTVAAVTVDSVTVGPVTVDSVTVGPVTVDSVTVDFVTVDYVTVEVFLSKYTAGGALRAHVFVFSKEWRQKTKDRERTDELA
jgi:hypothetical protein